MSIAGYAGAGQLGTQVLLPAIRKALDAERAIVYALVLLGELALLAAFGFAAGATLVQGPTWGLNLVLVWFVGWVMLACTAATLVWMAEAVARWWWHVHKRGRVRRGGGNRASIAPAPSGTPSTAVIRSRASLVTPWGFGLATTGSCLAMAVVTVRMPWVAAAFAAAAVACAVRVAPLVLGRATSGGVYLTPAGLELRWGVTTTTVPWDDLPAPQPWDDGRELRTPAATTVHRSWPVDMPTDVLDHVPHGVVAVPLTYLEMPAERLWALVDLGRSRPDLRRHFGTPSSLEWHVDGPPSPIS
jgi:hypothetical protein